MNRLKQLLLVTLLMIPGVTLANTYNINDPATWPLNFTINTPSIFNTENMNITWNSTNPRVTLQYFITGEPGPGQEALAVAGSLRSPLLYTEYFNGTNPGTMTTGTVSLSLRELFGNPSFEIQAGTYRVHFLDGRIIKGVPQTVSNTFQSRGNRSIVTFESPPPLTAPTGFRLALGTCSPLMEFFYPNIAGYFRPSYRLFVDPAPSGAVVRFEFSADGGNNFEVFDNGSSNSAGMTATPGTVYKFRARMTALTGTPASPQPLFGPYSEVITTARTPAQCTPSGIPWLPPLTVNPSMIAPPAPVVLTTFQCFLNRVDLGVQIIDGTNSTQIGQRLVGSDEITYVDAVFPDLIGGVGGYTSVRTKLTPGASYEYFARSTNRVNNDTVVSAWSAPSERFNNRLSCPVASTPNPNTTPATPFMPRVTPNCSGDKVDIVDIRVYPVLGATSYSVFYRLNNNQTPVLLSTLNTSTGGRTSHRLTWRQDGDIYQYMVRANNGNNSSSLSTPTPPRAFCSPQPIPPRQPIPPTEPLPPTQPLPPPTVPVGSNKSDRVLAFTISVLQYVQRLLPYERNPVGPIPVPPAPQQF